MNDEGTGVFLSGWGGMVEGSHMMASSFLVNRGLGF